MDNPQAHEEKVAKMLRQVAGQLASGTVELLPSNEWVTMTQSDDRATRRFRCDLVLKDRIDAAPSTARYQALDGSQSHSYCFNATVVDTTKPVILSGKHYDNLYEPVCECFDRADADRIAAALNAAICEAEGNRP